MPDNKTGISCNIKSLVINEIKSIKPKLPTPDLILYVHILPHARSG